MTSLTILDLGVAAISLKKLTLQMVGGAGATRPDCKHGSAELPAAPDQPFHHVFCHKTTW